MSFNLRNTDVDLQTIVKPGLYSIYNINQIENIPVSLNTGILENNYTLIYNSNSNSWQYENPSIFSILTLTGPTGPIGNIGPTGPPGTSSYSSTQGITGSVQYNAGGRIFGGSNSLVFSNNILNLNMTGNNTFNMSGTVSIYDGSSFVLTSTGCFRVINNIGICNSGPLFNIHVLSTGTNSTGIMLIDYNNTNALCLRTTTSSSSYSGCYYYNNGSINFNNNSLIVSSSGIQFFNLQNMINSHSYQATHYNRFISPSFWPSGNLNSFFCEKFGNIVYFSVGTLITAAGPFLAQNAYGFIPQGYWPARTYTYSIPLCINATGTFPPNVFIPVYTYGVFRVFSNGNFQLYNSLPNEMFNYSAFAIVRSQFIIDGTSALNIDNIVSWSTI